MYIFLIIFQEHQEQSVDEQVNINIQEASNINIPKETIPENDMDVPAKKSRPLSKLKQVSTVIKDLKQISDNIGKDDNQYIIFGRSFAAQLMALTSISAIKAQQQIQSILTNFKIRI